MIWFLIVYIYNIYIFLNLYSDYDSTNIGWNPELVFLTVVFFNSTYLAVVIPNGTVKNVCFTL